MAEYIERTRALDIARGTPAHYFLKIEPTADVVEVRHGEWLAAQSSVFPVFSCSLCGLPVATGRTNYCPNCGAKMDK